MLHVWRPIFSWSAIASRSLYNLIVFETWQLILISYRAVMHTVLFRRLLLRCTILLAMPQSYGTVLELSTERRRDVMGAILIQITRLSAFEIPSLSIPRSTISIPHSPYPSLIPNWYTPQCFKDSSLLKLVRKQVWLAPSVVRSHRLDASGTSLPALPQCPLKHLGEPCSMVSRRPNYACTNADDQYPGQIRECSRRA
jgi:hypothetical protein